MYKKIEITGATSGLGEATLRNLAIQNENINLLGGRNINKLQDIASSINALFIDGDLFSKGHACNSFIESNADVQIHCAAISPDNKLVPKDKKMKTAELQTELIIRRINFLRNQTFQKTQKLVIFISSVGAIFADLMGEKMKKNPPYYSPMKLAQLEIIRANREELYKKGIHLVTILPSMIKTPMIKKFSDKDAVIYINNLFRKFSNTQGHIEYKGKSIRSIQDKIFLPSDIAKVINFIVVKFIEENSIPRGFDEIILFNHSDIKRIVGG